MTALPQTVEEMEAWIKNASPEKRKKLEAAVSKYLGKCWLPQPGPQADAFKCVADETLYGGAAGGGKTDLLLGLATTEHYRSVIFRRQSTDLETIWNRLVVITAGRVVKKNASTKKMTLADDRFIEFGHLEMPGSEKSWQGNAHDLYGFDEAAQLDESKVKFVIQWRRSVDPRVRRTRVVFATNPPIPEFNPDGTIKDTGTGAWLKEWFAPWLDDTYPNQALPGEVRWCFMRMDGDRYATIWVEGPGGYNPETGARIENYSDEDLLAGRVAVAFSRTFIRSLLKDNAFLKNTGYAAQLSSTPEPLKSLLLNGSFTVKGEDHPFQVIPTMWVLEAQERWRELQRAGEIDKDGIPIQRHRQLVLSADIAQGGMDTFIVAPLHEHDIFASLLAQPGKLTPTGTEGSMLVLSRRKNGALVVLDGTGGWAGATRQALADSHHIESELCIASEGSTEWTDDMRYDFLNVRAEMWWLFRVALDPQSEYKIALPPSTRLQTQLTAPLFIIKGHTIKVEEKLEIRKRISSSTDEADAVIQGWRYRNQAIAERFSGQPDIVERLVHGTTDEEWRQRGNQAQPLEDPLKGFR